MRQTISIERIDHIGIRVHDLDRDDFYQVLGTSLLHRAVGGEIRSSPTNMTSRSA